MKYLVTVESLTYQDYLVEAESEEEAEDKALSGKEKPYGLAEPGMEPLITRTEVYKPWRR